MERIVFLERNTFDAEFRRPQFEHEWIDYGETDRGQIVERLRDATIAICNKLPLREPELSRLPQLKLIAVAATGVDNIDLSYCKSARDRRLQHAKLRQTLIGRTCADADAGLAKKSRRIHSRCARSAKWQQAKQFCLLNHTIRDLHGSKIGIIGYGSLGKAWRRWLGRSGCKCLLPNGNTQPPREKDAQSLRKSCGEATCSRFTVP